MADISPAQKIVAAFSERYELCGPFDDCWVEQCLAAAFRAAANQVAPACSALSDSGTKQMLIRHDFLAIAAELETTTPDTP